MTYQFKREPLRPEEADKLCQVCETVLEKMIIWVLLGTGMRVSELSRVNVKCGVCMIRQRSYLIALLLILRLQTSHY